MADNQLIIFVCQVLEYQPEPSNQWTTVGQLKTNRAFHAVLSIGSEALPCLQGSFEYADQNLKVKVDQVFNLSNYSSISHTYHMLKVREGSGSSN